MLREDVGNRIKLLRESRNLTREKLAEMADISSKFLYEVEKGRKGLSAESLFKITKTLSCSCDYILNGKSIERENDEQLTRLLQQFTDREREYAIKVLLLIQEMNEH